MNLLQLSPSIEKGIIEDANLLAEFAIPYFMGGKLDIKLSPQEIKKRIDGGDIKGVDCSGLVWYLYGRHGIKLQYIDGKSGSQSLFSNSKLMFNPMLKTGDLVFKEKNGIIEHVGIIAEIIPTPMVVEAEGWFGKVIKRPLGSFKTTKPNAAQFVGITRLIRDKVQFIDK